MTAAECRCGRPLTDSHTTCETCLGELTRALGDVRALDAELETSITRQRAVPAEGGASSSTALPWDEYAADARRGLHALLVGWVRFCDEDAVRTRANAPEDLPADNLGDLAAWLLWRVDGLGLHDLGPEAHEQITDAVAACWRAIDCAPERWFAGPCDGCGIDLYATKRTGALTCRECGQTYDVAERRAWLLEVAEDRLAPASTVARAVSTWGASPLTAERIRQWSHRGRILVKGHAGARPLYRIGDALDLVADEAATAS